MLLVAQGEAAIIGKRPLVVAVVVDNSGITGHGTVVLNLRTVLGFIGTGIKIVFEALAGGESGTLSLGTHEQRATKQVELAIPRDLAAVREGGARSLIGTVLHHECSYTRELLFERRGVQQGVAEEMETRGAAILKDIPEISACREELEENHERR